MEWILARQTRRLALNVVGAVVGGVCALLLAGAAFGSLRCWADWLSAIRSLPGEIITVGLGNFAPARILGDWFGFDITIVVAAVFGILVVGAMWWGRANAPAGRLPASESEGLPDVRAAATGCLLMLLAPRLAWLHYHVLTIPILLVVLRPLDESSSTVGTVMARRILPAVAILALAVDPIINVGIPLPASAVGVLVMLATLLLFALGLRELSLAGSSGDPKRR